MSALAGDLGDEDEDSNDDDDFQEDDGGMDGDHDLEDEADEAEATFQAQVASSSAGKRARDGSAADGEEKPKRSAR